MKLHELKPTPGSTHKKKIVGRGEGSGHGGSATRGTKGQGSRSGETCMVGFEGGQMPLIRRIPKRGFSHARFKTRYGVVNVCDIEAVFKAQDVITPKELVQKKLVRKACPVKILSIGEIKKAVTVKAQAFSEKAEEKIKAAGGTVEKLS